MTKTKIVYKAFSCYEFIKSVFLRGCLLVGAGYYFTHLEDYPIVVSVATLLCLFFVLIIGDDRIIVYSDKVV